MRRPPRLESAGALLELDDLLGPPASPGPTHLSRSTPVSTTNGVRHSNIEHTVGTSVVVTELACVASKSMYEQIAANKRRAVVYVALFFVVWVGLGALLGWIVAASSNPYPTGSSVVAGDIVTGAMIAGLLALAGIAYTLTSGTRLVLAVSGAHTADPIQYRQLHDIVEALAIGDGLPKPQVYVIDDP